MSKFLSRVVLDRGRTTQGTFSAITTADLPSSGVTAGSYTLCSITVDATGRVTAAASGTTPVAVTNGGTGTATAFTAGSVVFAGPSGVYAQDNANLFWDDANNRLGIGTAAPSATLHVAGSSASLQMQLQDTLNTGVSSIACVNDTGAAANIALHGSGTANTNFVNVPSAGRNFCNGAGGLFLMATNAAGQLRFVTNGTAFTSERMNISAAGIVTFPNGTVLQNTSGRARNTADVTNVTTAFASLTDLSLTLVAGRKYTGRVVLAVNDATAADGFKFDLNGGSATMTSVEFGVSAALAATVGVRTSTALATALTLTALGDTSDVFVEIPVTLVCNAAGTVIPRQAKNSDAAGATLTVRAGSYFHLDDSPN